jgi:serine/threonine protein kinase
MAPEQALGAVTVGPATDVWSIGVVIARCLTGKLPFASGAASRAGVLRHGLGPDDLPGVPEPVASVLRAALQFEPGERPRDMAVFRSALLAALQRVSKSEPWPGETSVSFAESECELAHALAHASPSPLETGPASTSVPGRPEHVMTQTLERDPSTLPKSRRQSARRRVLGAVSLALGALVAARIDWRSAESIATTSAASLPAPVTAAAESALATATLPEPTATLAVQSPARTESEQRKHDASANVSGAKPARTPKRARHGARSAPAAASTTRAPSAATPARATPSPLGANRSPIIE